MSVALICSLITLQQQCQAKVNRTATNSCIHMHAFTPTKFLDSVEQRTLRIRQSLLRQQRRKDTNTINVKLMPRALTSVASGVSFMFLVSLFFLRSCRNVEPTLLRWTNQPINSLTKRLLCFNSAPHKFLSYNFAGRHFLCQLEGTGAPGECFWSNC